MKRIALFFLSVCVAATVTAQQKNIHSPGISQQVNGKTIFKVDVPDYKLSPFTGVTRKHWKDAAKYLLEGAFSYIHNIDDAMRFPKMPGKSYPRTEAQIPTEKLEGLCRTLFVAVPLLKENPALEINGMKVGDYYRHQLISLSDSTKTTFIKHRAKNGGPSQILVEFGGLSVSLFAAPEILWQPLTQKQKDDLAALMLSYGDGPTIGSNWKFFNIFVLSFFKSQGYTVNEKLLVEYVEKSLAHYRGNGWYHDAPAYDYYSMWAFEMYGPLWSEFFGNKYYPQYAQQFVKNFSEVKTSYPYMFSRNGTMIMWGRSMTYRFGSVIPFALMGLQNDAAVNYGWMRRIASGTLLQFLKNPDFLQDNIPTLGVYGAFEPAVQSYSCRGSVFWMGKAFLGLLVPENSPFWTAKENEGAWQTEMKKENVYNHYADSSHILITDYPNIGASEIRAWCKVKLIGAGEPFRSSENYNRLAYNSAFPWQADSVPGVVAMNYLIKNKKNEWEALRLYDFKKFEDGAYYRDVALETNPNIKLNLIDMPLPNGILRIDRLTGDTSFDFRLGHYALPQLKTAIKETTKKVNGYNVSIIDNGEYQLAMVTLKGWNSMKVMQTQGVHPVSEVSKVINASDFFDNNSSSVINITLMLWKRSGKAFTNEELLPVKNISVQGKNEEVRFMFQQKQYEVNL